MEELDALSQNIQNVLPCDSKLSDQECFNARESWFRIQSVLARDSCWPLPVRVPMGTQQWMIDDCEDYWVYARHSKREQRQLRQWMDDDPKHFFKWTKGDALASNYLLVTRVFKW